MVALTRMCASRVGVCVLPYAPYYPPLARPSHAYLALPSGRLALGGGLVALGRE